MPPAKRPTPKKAPTKTAGKKPAAKKAPAKVAGKASGKPASKASKAAPTRASKGGWRPRFEAMVAELRANKKVEGVEASFAPSATDAEIAEAERSFGRPIDAEIVAFYREMNGFDLQWESKASDDERGHIHIQPIEKVFGDWKNVIWFDHEGGGELRSLLPFDFFVPEACMAFDASEAPLRVHYHYCGEERSATGYGFAEYLERLLASRGYFYWVHTLCEDEDQADSGEAEAFLSNVQRLFPGVDKRLFRSKAVDFGALSLEELVSRVKTDEESEAPKALAMEVASRPASAARLRDLLAEASPEPRIRALKIALLVQCEETEYEALGLLQHPSAAVREALVREIVSCLGCSGRHEKEKRLLAAIAADEREETRIREMASSALGI